MMLTLTTTVTVMLFSGVIAINDGEFFPSNTQLSIIDDMLEEITLSREIVIKGTSHSKIYVSHSLML